MSITEHPVYRYLPWINIGTQKTKQKNENQTWCIIDNLIINCCMIILQVNVCDIF